MTGRQCSNDQIAPPAPVPWLEPSNAGTWQQLRVRSNRPSFENVAAGIYARDLFKPGSKVAVGDDHGVLESVGTFIARIKVADNIFVHIPNSQLVDALVREETGGNDEAAGASKD